MSNEWAITPRRITAIVLTDANAQLCHDEEDGAVGIYGTSDRRPNETATTLTTWMQTTDVTAINTHFKTGPTYVTQEGIGKTIDYIIAPRELLQIG